MGEGGGAYFIPPASWLTLQLMLGLGVVPLSAACGQAWLGTVTPSLNWEPVQVLQGRVTVMSTDL